MLAELQGTHTLLQRWSKNPDAAASDTSPFTADRDKHRPFTREEITRAAAFLNKHAPTAMASLAEDLRKAGFGTAQK